MIAPIEGFSFLTISLNLFSFKIFIYSDWAIFIDLVLVTRALLFRMTQLVIFLKRPYLGKWWEHVFFNTSLFFLKIYFWSSSTDENDFLVFHRMVLRMFSSWFLFLLKFQHIKWNKKVWICEYPPMPRNRSSCQQIYFYKVQPSFSTILSQFGGKWLMTRKTEIKNKEFEQL